MKFNSLTKILFGTVIASTAIKAIQKFSETDCKTGLNGEDIIRLTFLAKHGYYPLFYDHMMRKLPWIDDDYVKEEYIRLGSEENDPPLED
jgi:hypothetical protein